MSLDRASGRIRIKSSYQVGAGVLDQRSFYSLEAPVLRVGGQLRMLVSLRRERVPHRLIKRLERLGCQLAAEARLALFVPAIAVLKLFEGGGIPPGIGRHKPKRFRTSESGMPSVVPSTMPCSR